MSSIELWLTWSNSTRTTTPKSWDVSYSAESFEYKIKEAPVVPFVGSVVDTPHGAVEVLSHRYDYGEASFGPGCKVRVHIKCRPY